METIESILVIAHLFGMAAIVGSFRVQLCRETVFVLIPLLTGAIV